MSLLEDITDQLNLRWAWEKVKSSSVPGDVWFDEVEIASFELDLYSNLNSIGRDIKNGRYELKKIRPMPFPKAAGEDGKQRIRQYFHIAIRDQVAWVAIVNVIGPIIDSHMPNWSYGNRLFRSVWVEEKETGARVRKVGPYRHSNGRIYLPFKQSWPIYRRHVFLATRAMSKSDYNNLSDEDNLEYELSKSLDRRHQCDFIFRDFWSNRPNKSQEGLYWCSLDFEKFYPSIDKKIIISNILEFIPSESLFDAKNLLERMFSFEINFDELSDQDIDNLNLNRDLSNFNNIPTGLYVSGFLANTALLGIDRQVDQKLQKQRSIAHFRFVDDHIIIAFSFDDLLAWIDNYEAIINSSDTGCSINPEKTEPHALSQYFQARKTSEMTNEYSNAKEACELDPEFPSPLMTKTLALVSGIGRANFHLMEEGELSGMIAQLEHMLLVELPETEIPERTRLAFAATRLANIAQVNLENHVVAGGSNAHQELGLHGSSNNFELRALDTSYSLHIGEISRIFSLLKKVLRDRPDRVRLWTRAIILCRQTGLQKLGEIFSEIDKIKNVNVLASEYLIANSLSLLGSNALVASKVLNDNTSPIWRRLAAYKFLQDISSLKVDDIKPKKIRHDLDKSWRLFCFGVYCANLNMRANSSNKEFNPIDFPESVISYGKNSLLDENATALAWWASRRFLSDLEARADHLTLEIGHSILNKQCAIKYWQHYPCDIPLALISDEISKNVSVKENSKNQGWWFDVINYNPHWSDVDSDSVGNSSAKKAISNQLYFLGNKTHQSLLEWSAHAANIARLYPSDPRISEWTSLEIARQISHTLIKPLLLDNEYVNNRAKKGWRPSGVHPANYRIPNEWFGSEPVSWEAWKETVRKNCISQIPDKYKIFDYRYSPVIKNTNDVNAIRGIGIVLACLLRRSFELPSIWNGNGQADVLKLLPILLMKRITCSSLTLGLLQSCLNSRVLENTLRLHEFQSNIAFDKDTECDPVSFIQLEDLGYALNLCQEELARHQLSTLNQQARQLTPIDLRLLTDPNWGSIFIRGEYLNNEE